MITELEAVIPPPAEEREGAGADHPMRIVTREVAFEPERWTPERRAKVAALFDGLAPEWHTRWSPGRVAQLPDALDRGLPAAGWSPPDGVVTCVEIGSGTGMFTGLLVERFATVVALDLAMQMLRLAPAGVGQRVQGDASELPLAGGSVDVLVLVNALLFPAEAARVLAASGSLVWVNSGGERTPIHLPVADVAAALPGHWDGVESRAHEGTWGVLRRRTT